MLLYQFAETILRAHQSCIIESYFHPEFATSDLLALQERSPFTPIQVHCHTSLSLALERYQQRFESGERHPGHIDQVHLPAMRAALLTQPELQPLAIGGHIIELDTTDFAAIDYEKLFDQVWGFMESEMRAG